MRIEKADPRARQIIAIAFALVMLFGAALLAAATLYGSTLEAWVLADVKARVPVVLATGAALAAGPSLAFGGYLWSLGRRIMHSGTYPPPGLWLVRDTPVLEGPEALTRGRLMKGIAVAIAVSGTLLAFLIWRMAALIAPF